MATSCLFGVSCSAACDLIRATCVCRHEFATFSMVSFVQFGCCDVSTASNYPPLTRIYLSIRFFFILRTVPIFSLHITGQSPRSFILVKRMVEHARPCESVIDVAGRLK